MSTRSFIQSLSSMGVRLSIGVRGVRVVAPKGVVTPAVRKDLSDRKDEILAILAARPDTPPNPPVRQPDPLIEDGRRVRWRLADERGCRKCKRCRGPIIWAQVVEDTDPKAKRNAWIRLDPDHMPHGCGGPRAGRFIDPFPDIHGGTPNGDK